MATNPETRPSKTPFAYLRVKRKELTLFVETDLEGGATGEMLHKSVARLMHVPAEKLRLVRRDGNGFLALRESEKLSEQRVKCDSVIVAVLQDENGIWEDPSTRRDDE